MSSPKAGENGGHPSPQRSAYGDSLFAAVFGFGDVVAPLGLGPLLAFAEAFGDGKVGHEVIGRGTVPVPLPWRGLDGVAGSYLCHICVAGLDKAAPFSHVQGLTVGMPMPCVTSPRRETHHVDPYPRGSIALRNDV